MAVSDIYIFANNSCKYTNVINRHLQHYSFTFEDITAFLNYFTKKEPSEAIRRGLVSMSGRIKTKKVHDIVCFLTVEIYNKQIRFDKTETYNNLNIEVALKDVKQYLQGVRDNEENR